MPTHSDLDRLRAEHPLTDDRDGKVVTTARFLPDYCARANEVNREQKLPHLVWRPSYQAKRIGEVLAEPRYWWQE